MRPLTYDNRALESVCRQYHVRRLAVFGSVLRGDDTPGSDLDLLVEFEPGHGVGFFGLARLQDSLTEIFERTVDLQTPGFLNQAFRSHVVNNARSLYAR
jgi:predicted nucleotidyltransferase